MAKEDAKKADGKATVGLEDDDVWGDVDDVSKIFTLKFY